LKYSTLGSKQLKHMLAESISSVLVAEVPAERCEQGKWSSVWVILSELNAEWTASRMHRRTDSIFPVRRWTLERGVRTRHE
jgi:hypothetical protein